jgi:hypothetical protein
LKHEIKPDVIHLTNALLSGMVEILANELQVPVICSLQGDDIFLNALPEKFRTKAIDLISANAGLINKFVASSFFYADDMSKYLGVPKEKLASYNLELTPNFINPGLEFKNLVVCWDILQGYVLKKGFIIW